MRINKGCGWKIFHVRCTACGATSASFGHRDEAQENAREAWNQRAAVSDVVKEAFEKAKENIHK